MSKNRHNFNGIAKGGSKKREAPFSLRLTFEERAKLEAAANGMAMCVAPSRGYIPMTARFLPRCADAA